MTLGRRDHEPIRFHPLDHLRRIELTPRWRPFRLSPWGTPGVGCKDHSRIPLSSARRNDGDSAPEGYPIRLSAFGLSDVGRRRTVNEDDLAVVNLQDRRVFDPPRIDGLAVEGRGVLLAVCDGVGGHRAGEIASGLALESLVEEIEALSGPECAPDQAFRKAVENVNSRVWKRAGRDPQLHGMATTLTAVVVCPTNMIVAHVGDSRAYLLRDGRLTQLTRDQSFVESMVSSGALTEEEAKASPYRNMILQAIGREKKIDVALDQIAPAAGDTLLLCTDGLCGVIGSDAIQATMARPLLEENVRELIGLANQAGGPDNITVLAARLDRDAPPRAAQEAKK